MSVYPNEVWQAGIFDIAMSFLESVDFGDGDKTLPKKITSITFLSGCVALRSLFSTEDQEKFVKTITTSEKLPLLLMDSMTKYASVYLDASQPLRLIWTHNRKTTIEKNPNFLKYIILNLAKATDELKNMECRRSRNLEVYLGVMMTVVEFDASKAKSMIDQEMKDMLHKSVEQIATFASSLIAAAKFPIEVRISIYAVSKFIDFYPETKLIMEKNLDTFSKMMTQVDMLSRKFPDKQDPFATGPLATALIHSVKNNEEYRALWDSVGGKDLYSADVERYDLLNEESTKKFSQEHTQSFVSGKSFGDNTFHYEMNKPSILTCAFCNAKDPKKKCGSCYSVLYCNSNCQRSDWKKHKPLCKPKSK